MQINNLRKIAGICNSAAKYYVSQGGLPESEKMKKVATFARKAYGNPQDAFMHYLWKKDTRTVKTLLETGLVEIDAKDKFGRTPLLTAIYNRDYDMVRLLVARGADLEATSDFGLSALNMALLHGDIRTSQFLIEKGSEKNGVTNALQQLNFYLDDLIERSNRVSVFGDFGITEGRIEKMEGG